MHERGLQEVQGEHRGFLVFAVGAGELAVFAVEDDGVGAVPVLDDLEAVVDLASEVGVGEVVADERGADGAAELFERLVGGVLGAAAGEAPQHLLGFGGPEAQRGGVLDELVVLPGDELPADRGLYRRLEEVLAPADTLVRRAAGARYWERRRLIHAIDAQLRDM